MTNLGVIPHADESPLLLEPPPTPQTPEGITPGVYEIKKESPALSMNFDEVRGRPTVGRQYLGESHDRQVSLNLESGGKKSRLNLESAVTMGVGTRAHGEGLEHQKRAG